MNHTDDKNDNSAETEQPIPAPAQVVQDIPPTSKEEIQPILPKTAEAVEDILDTEILGVSDVVKETAENIQISPISPLSDTGVHQLANAMVGRPYLVELDLWALNLEGAILYSTLFAEQTENLGLSIEHESNILRIKGTPKPEAKGEQTLALDYTYDKVKIYRKTFQLLVNPDPRSLWKEIEPDPDAPYQKNHTAAETLTGKDFQVIVASRRGRSHAQEGKFREDDFAVRICENGWYLLIVSDGAGSAKFSREGSRLACQTAIDFLEAKVAELLAPKMDDFVLSGSAPETEKEIRNILYQTLAGAAFAAYKRLEKESETTGNPIKDYSCTFLATIVKNHQGKKFIASFGIGDGAIAVYDEPKKTVNLMNSPDGGEFSGQTRFLTMREIIGDSSEMFRRLRFLWVNDFTLLFLMTDGISDPKFGTDKNLLLPEKWTELGEDLITQVGFKRGDPENSNQLLEWLNFWATGEHDDRTLAILH
jgi:hypothetical protein